MNISQILTNEELRRFEFPVAREKIFLAHAGVCPLPRRVVEAIRHYGDLCTQDDQETILPGNFFAELREAAGRVLGAQPDEIALVGPTSLGLSYVAAGLPWKKNDNVVIYREDYPSNVYPWMALAERGVEVRFVETAEYGRIRLEEVLRTSDSKTRLVALASCHFVTGCRIDLDGIGAALQERGILFCVDGIQTVGAFPCSLRHVDFLAADAHKWMLGPCAAGLLYVRKELQDQLRAPVYGWHNVRCPNFVAQEEIQLRGDARRYEAGSHNLLGLAGLKASLELLLEAGVEAISRELLHKGRWLREALEKKGFAVLGGNPSDQEASGIVSFFRAGTDMAGIHQRLQERRIHASLRADRAGRRFIRFSPHFYNTNNELEQAVDALS